MCHGAQCDLPFSRFPVWFSSTLEMLLGLLLSRFQTPALTHSKCVASCVLGLIKGHVCVVKHVVEGVVDPPDFAQAHTDRKNHVTDNVAGRNPSNRLHESLGSDDCTLNAGVVVNNTKLFAT